MSGGLAYGQAAGDRGTKVGGEEGAGHEHHREYTKNPPQHSKNVNAATEI
jgi:hypothetical protein